MSTCEQIDQVEYVSLDVGDGTLTRRILKRCRDTGIAVRTDTVEVHIGYGRHRDKIVSYRVPKTIHDEEHARRRAEVEKKEEVDQRKREKELAAYVAAKTAELTSKYPQLKQSAIEKIAKSNKSAYSADEVGYQYGVGTKTYWRQLGFIAAGTSTGVLVVGNRLYDTYRSYQLTPRPTCLTVKKLKEKLLAKYGSEELVLAQAIRIANRIQKINRIAKFYPLKDKWIMQHQDHLIEGRVTRHEHKTCWGCGGSGERDDEPCSRCDGTGCYTNNTLYEHTFSISGEKFSYHSYTKPTTISAGQGVDCKHYGRPFDGEDLPCPPQAVLVDLIESMMG